MDLRKLIKEKLPRHIAIIMDGNGRWARRRALARIMGHRRGMESVQEVVRACRDLGIRVLSLYAFSTENWKRPKYEIRSLMTLLKKYMRAEIKDLHANNIRVNAIGGLEKLPGDVLQIMDEAVALTRNNTGMVLNVALSYSGRDEIIRAVADIARKVEARQMKVGEINEATFAQHLFTADLVDPDLLIRTSGELRVSNFMLWQIAYTEIYVTDVLWPDFRKADLIKALEEYQKRKRRFGLTDEQIRST